MTLDEIKSAINAGKIVCWKNPMYVVRKNGYKVVYTSNGDCNGDCDGVTMEYAEKDFFVLESEIPEVIIYHRERW